MSVDSHESERLTVSVPQEQAERLRELAAANKVSVAWLIRRAIDRLLEDDNAKRVLPEMDAAR